MVEITFHHRRWYTLVRLTLSVLVPNGPHADFEGFDYLCSRINVSELAALQRLDIITDRSFARKLVFCFVSPVPPNSLSLVQHSYPYDRGFESNY